MNDPSWNDLQRRDEPREPPVSAAFDELCFRIFTSPDGRELLQALRRRHFDSGFDPAGDDRALRVRIARQQFVRDLEIARDRGQAANRPKGT